MTEKISSMSSMPKEAKKTVSRSETERTAVRKLVKAARARGEELTGPDGLLKAITATVLETALEEELTEHLGHEKHQAPTSGSGNIRNGTRPKTVLTDAAGEVSIAVPRDRAGTFEPVIVKKRQRRLTDVDAVAISLFAKGLTTGEISAHFHEVYGASICKDTRWSAGSPTRCWKRWRPGPPARCSRCTRRSSSTRSMSRSVTGRSATSPSTPQSGSTWAGAATCSACGPGRAAVRARSSAMFVLADLKNRGVRDVFFLVCDGLKGLPDSVNAVFPQAIVQACVIHLIRATLRYASRRYWDQLAKDLRRIYTAPSVEAAWAAFEELEEKWGKPYPAIPKMWRAAWEEFIPFLAYDVEIRRVLFSTNAIESLHARYRRAVTVRGHFPTEQAALKCLYLVTRGLDPKGTGQARWTMRWKPALNAFAVTFADRMPAAENL
jgi:transposase-like protein